MRRLLLALLGLALLAGLGWWWHQPSVSETAAAAAPNAAPARPAPGIPVRTSVVETAAMPVEVSAIGRIEPLATVTVRSRIDSAIESAHFTEGQEVKTGDLLFTLDDGPPAATLRAAQANLAKDQAQLTKAKADVARYSDLIKSNAVAHQQYETAVADASSLQASVEADQAQIDQAKLTLAFTQIRSPIDGRTGAMLVDPGNLVKGNDNGGTGLVTITQLRPIAASFTLPERYLDAIREARQSGRELQVTVTTSGADLPPVVGRLSFVDSTVDETTGTIMLKGEFANADTRLWPGQFANVTLRLAVEPQALSVPGEAVQVGQDGPFVFRVKPDGTVEMRAVTIDRNYQNRSVIKAGLAAGDKVVVEGQLRLVPGSHVAERGADTKDKGAAPAGAAPAKVAS
jgi:multidrug efflux system membrane fusion protein